MEKQFNLQKTSPYQPQIEAELIWISQFNKKEGAVLLLIDQINN